MPVCSALRADGEVRVARFGGHEMSGGLTAKRLRVSAGSTRRIVAVASLLAWLPAACLAIDAKYRLLEASGFEAVCDQLQRTIDPNRDPATYFSYFERLCLMRLDVTIAWALVPALLLVVTRRLRPSLAAAFVIACSSAATLLLFIQERSLATMGSFVTFGMLYDALDWAITEPTVAGPYLFTANNLKVLASLVLIVGATVAAHRWVPRLAPEWIRKRRSRLALVPGFAVAAIAWIPVVPSSAANTSALVFGGDGIVSERRERSRPVCRNAARDPRRAVSRNDALAS